MGKACFSASAEGSGLTRAQIYAALYQLGERVTLEPVRGSLPWTAGLRGVFDCLNCNEEQKRERGHCPFLEQSTDGTEPIYIDTTNTDHDVIRHCPRSIQLKEPLAQRDINLFHLIEKLGGAHCYYPQPLSMQDTATLETYSMIKAIQSRFVADVKRRRMEMDRRPT